MLIKVCAGLKKFVHFCVNEEDFSTVGIHLFLLVLVRGMGWLVQGTGGGGGRIWEKMLLKDGKGTFDLDQNPDCLHAIACLSEKRVCTVELSSVYIYYIYCGTYTNSWAYNL